jgi:hypothetical protein
LAAIVTFAETTAWEKGTFIQLYLAGLGLGLDLGPRPCLQVEKLALEVFDLRLAKEEFQKLALPPRAIDAFLRRVFVARSIDAISEIYHVAASLAQCSGAALGRLLESNELGHFWRIVDAAQAEADEAMKQSRS